jgi:hypothetical protein
MHSYRPVPGGGTAYGLLPANMTAELVDRIKENAHDRSTTVVSRDDEALNKEVPRRKKVARKLESDSTLRRQVHREFVQRISAGIRAVCRPRLIARGIHVLPKAVLRAT